MVLLVEPQWLKDRLTAPDVVVVDPRSPMKYLQGHIEGAVNLPLARILDVESSELLPDERLLQVFSAAGTEQHKMVVLYDEFDGQSAAMIAWTLEYLGHPDVKILDTFLEGWKKNGYEIRYRPVKPRPGNLQANPNRKIRTFWQDIVADKALKLVDLRSEEEFHGLDNATPRTGHLPSALNIPWTKLLGRDHRLFVSATELQSVIQGVSPDDSIVAYCNYGPRAALGYIALQQLGYRRVSVYDGSFHQWSQLPQLPVDSNQSS